MNDKLLPKHECRNLAQFDTFYRKVIVIFVSMQDDNGITYYPSRTDWQLGFFFCVFRRMSFVQFFN